MLTFKIFRTSLGTQYTKCIHIRIIFKNTLGEQNFRIKVNN